jgi:RNA-directed DNA polymerase
MRRTVKGWLKAGVMEGVEFSPTEEGAPQGGVLSPLLANVALYGMEEAVHQTLKRNEGKPSLIRYADDFVVLHPTREGVEKARQVIERWLQGIGLELKPSKTRLVHTLEGMAGFDFLGFNVRQYRVGKTRSAHSTTRKPLGVKTLIKPSPEAIKRHVAELGKIVRVCRGASQEELIDKLNPVIIGWIHYHRTVVASQAFGRCDTLLFSMLRRWAFRRHPTKPRGWVVHKYWAMNQGEGWKFKARDETVLKYHRDTPIRRHTKVQGTASPYNGNLIYWAQRLRDHPLTNTRTAYLLRLQKGQCARCGLYFHDGEVVESDHIIPKSLGGDDRVMNLQLLHRHSHDQKTAQDGSYQARTGQGVFIKDHLIEEPCDRKRSSTVLERGREW